MIKLHNIRSQYSIFTFLLIVLLICTSIHTVLAQTTDDTDIPTHTDIKRQLNRLNEQKELSTQDKLVQEDLTKTLETLNKIDRIKDEGVQFKQKLTQAPEELLQATKRLLALKKVNNNEETRKNLANLSLSQLESCISQLLDELQITQKNLATYDNQLILLQTQPERAQNIMHSASQQLQQIRNRLHNTSVRDGALRSSQQILLLTKQSLLNAQIEHQRKRLENNTVLQDTLQKQRDYVIANINYLEHHLQLLQAAVNNKYLIITAKNTQEIISPNTLPHFQANLLIKKELNINQKISQRLMQATENNNTLVQRNIQVKNWLDRALQFERNIKEQIVLLKGSLLLSRILYQQQQMLPSADKLEDMTNHIADLRLTQFDVNQMRVALEQGNSFIHELNGGYTDEINDKIHNMLLQIVDIRRELLSQLNKQLGNQLMMAISLQINQQQLISVLKSLQEIFTQQIFWVNSNKAMNLEWIRAFPGALKKQIKRIKINVHLERAWSVLTMAFLTGLPLLLLAGFIQLRLNWFKQCQAKLTSQIGQLHNDSQLHTPKAILIDLIRAGPACLLILATGLILLIIRLNISDLLWASSKKLSLFWLVFDLCRKVLEKNGIAVRHFGMPELLINHWSQQIMRVALVLLPLHFWSVISDLSPLYLIDDVLGQLVILFNLLLIAILILPIYNDSWCNQESYTIRLATITVLSIVPIALMVLVATGYFYTTLRLAGRWIETIYLIIFWNLLYKTVLRGISVASRRIAYQHTLTQRQHLIIRRIGWGEKKERTVALEHLNQQALRITHMVMILLFVIIFWTIWSDLITVFSYLDNIILWHYSGTQGSAVVIKSVTMASLLFAIIVSIVVLALIRNLPGLLEMLILSRLKLRQGASYAITTILNYVIIIVGVMIIFVSLGISWNKLQWLAAALSVGLGFGLQEIFGNFVSGLIILFERPVRIGDTVTIGTFSGTVSKIRIRATTITDFDRKEVIIPNKAFVTERLINWSLSDTITRVVIRLGVAYGSNLDKVKEVLLRAAAEHPKVMRDPAPAVFFTTFGTSTLNHELRLYVRELRDRSHTVDELNRSIDLLCRKNNINIAFNRLEVHLHNEKEDLHTDELSMGR